MTGAEIAAGDGAGSEPSLSIGPVERTPRLSELVSERLVTAIRDAGLPPGAKLPSERDLAEQFGVSRTVTREAIRDLAAKGLLDIRSGSGARIAKIDGSGVSESLVMFLRRRGPLDPEKINEVRETLELETVRITAERASDEELREIRRAHESMRNTASDPEAASEADVAFHRAIARATDNELYLVLVDSLGDVLMEIRRTTLTHDGRAQDAMDQHGRIIEALERRDVQGAIQAMRDHLVYSLEAFRNSIAP